MDKIMQREYRICSRCVMDTTDPEIEFDEHGFCNHCFKALKYVNEFLLKDENQKKIELDIIVNKIKEEAKNKKYDCIIGLSGGIDSSYLALIVKDLGLRPLAVHVDNGWNSELAVRNIENIVTKLDIDLYTHVIDWELFKDIQNSYLKASVIDLEVLSDNAIFVGINKVASKFNIKHFLSGSNYASESILPNSWIYSIKWDTLNIKTIYKKFGNGKKMDTFLMFNLYEYIKYTYFIHRKNYRLLNYVDYNRNDAKKILQEKLDWQDYGRKHGESKITKFYQGYILPEKFNVDKRKAHLSSMICSGQLTRDKALEELKKPLYEKEQLQEEIEYFTKKLGLTKLEFEYIMKAPIKQHHDYKSYYRFHKRITNFIKKVIFYKK